MDDRPVNSGRFIVAGLFILAGILLLLTNLNIISGTVIDFLFTWQVLLIVIGAIIFANSKSSSGLALMLVGGLFLIDKYSGFSVWAYWPVILIILGIYMLVNFRRTPQNHLNGGNADMHQQFHDPKYKGEKMEQDTIDETAVFSGGKRYFVSNNFRGGKITAVFGGSEIDLTQCKLAPGKNIIDMVAIFGGGTLYIPRDWKVRVNVTPIFGGFSDERRIDPSVVYPDDRILEIRGTVIFGGGEIKTY